MTKKPAKPLAMKGADIFVEALLRAGVDTMFAYPGGASMEIHQALTRIEGRKKTIRVILPRHEQGGVFAAEGYAKVTGKAGVMMTTSGPGATNLVSGIADAMLDSVPLVCITGQVSTPVIGRDAFQETDVTGVTRSITKHSFLVKSVSEIPAVVAEAFRIAETGRPGPVVIDLPKDVQQAIHVPDFAPKPVFRQRKFAGEASVAEIAQVAAAIMASSRPVLYVGGGAVSSGAAAEIRKLAELCEIPVALTLMGLGVLPASHPLFYGMLGMHGSVASNHAVHHCDLLLAFGVRFDDRVTGKLDEFARNAQIVHIDIDESELNKNKRADIGIVSDLRSALRKLLPLLKARKHTAWIKELDRVRTEKPFKVPNFHGKISPQAVLTKLNERITPETIICTGVGQHQMFSAQYLKFERPRRWVTSGGLGAMGFGFPAAIGAQIARPDALVINIDGDGSFQMNIQELATLYVERIPIKCVILNNQHLGMVAQWEDRFYDANRGHTMIGDPYANWAPYPDFERIASGYKVQARRVEKMADLDDALDEMIASKGPFILDVITPYQEHVLPMIPANKTYHDLIYE